MSEIRVIEGDCVAGQGLYSHAVPVDYGRVVFIRDGNHEGTSIWRMDDDRYAFACHETHKLRFADRVILVAGVSADWLSAFDVYGCDLDIIEGMGLIGVEEGEHVELGDGAWIIWDSHDH